MLADGESQLYAGCLRRDIHLRGEWLTSLMDFIARNLPSWRDDPARPQVSGETHLAAQLCGYLNSISRLTKGWDFLQFRREEPDQTNKNRAIDLVVSPSGSLIQIDGMTYNEYQSLLSIECKRLPTPKGPKRDEREYLHSLTSSTGGVQRFKMGHHGASQARAAIIAYVQQHNIAAWQAKIEQWLGELEAEGVAGWSRADALRLTKHDPALRVACLQSQHNRNGGLEDIVLDHMWIEISPG